MRQIPLILWALPALLAGCASGGIYLPDGTIMLGEISHVLTREQVVRNSLGPDTKVEGSLLEEGLTNSGFTAEQIDRGQVVVVKEGEYWYNVVSGIRRPMLSPVLLPVGICADRGNIVEFRTRNKSGPPPMVLRVRASTFESGRCKYDELPTSIAKGLLGAVSMVGPGGAATLYCEGIEKEGWQRPRTYWHKLPSSNEVESVETHVGQINSAQQDSTCKNVPSPHSSLADMGLATLIFRRPYAANWAARDLSFWIGKQKIVELRAGSYSQVTVAAGQYLLSAAGEGSMSFPKREIQISLLPGERVVAEYLIDDSVYNSEGLTALFKREETAGKAIIFRSRPEFSSGERALRYTKPIVDPLTQQHNPR